MTGKSPSGDRPAPDAPPAPDGERQRRGRAHAALRPRDWAISVATVLAVTALMLILPRVLAPVAAMQTLIDDIRIGFFAPPQAQNGEILLIAITEETLATFPYRSPIDRGFLADLIGSLQDAGVRAVGLDILIDQPTEQDKDERLRRMLEMADIPVVAATVVDPFPLTERQRTYHDAFLEGATTGFVNLAKDVTDGVVRRQFPLQSRDGVVSPSFPARLALALGYPIPLEPSRIDWQGRPDSETPPFRAYPAHSVGFLPADWLAGRIALIGLVAPGIDEHRTPLSLQRGAMAGVEVHAHVLAQLMAGDSGAGFGIWSEVGLVLAMAAAGTGLAMMRIALWLKALASAALLAGFWVGGFVGFRWGGPLMPMILPTAAFALSAGIETGLVGGRHRRQSHYIRDAFSRYVSPAVVARLEQQPEELKIGGDRREITVVFTDLEGFTATARQLSPEALADLLNAYLDGMVDIVLAHEGTVDKFVGDAVIAFFGAPEAQPDHGERAVACAIAMDRFAEEFRGRQSVAGRGIGRTRIGVHTGAAVVGNFGGKTRFNYTAIGDAVNIGSRLEGANRYLGTRLLVSAETAARCPGRQFRPIAELLVKGQAETVFVVEPVFPDRHPEGYLEAYAEAYRMLDERQEDALAAFERLAARSPDDPLVALYLERLRHQMPGSRMVLTEK